MTQNIVFLHFIDAIFYWTFIGNALLMDFDVEPRNFLLFQK